MSFENDIKGQNTQLYPVVQINNNWYSTNNVTVGDNYCKPILMNIPSIKESIDIESRKFKISNVSLQFNNFPFDGVRFSDQLSESSLILLHSAACSVVVVLWLIKSSVIVNGDLHDLRLLDPKNVVVGLKAKGKAKTDYSGFVMN